MLQIQKLIINHYFDQRHGEGELIFKDFNNDNTMDIIHIIANYGYPNPLIVQVYINNN